jgi:hypothetical protein
LMRLSDTWMNETEDVSKSRFNLQIAFLTALIPDKSIREEIERERAELVAIFKKVNDPYAEQRAAFSVVSKMILFICQTFDLTHQDITGATCDSVAELNAIPPMNQEGTTDA